MSDSENEIEISVEIVNLRYRLRGFNAIRDLKEWLDAHASAVENANYNEYDAPDAPTPTTAPETP